MPNLWSDEKGKAAIIIKLPGSLAERMTTVTVIGAGPAGGFSAYLLAKAGMDVRVFEEHGTIGEPVACTGVITADVMAQRLQLPKELIVNRVAKARIFAPNGQSVEIKLKNDIIIKRAGF